MRWGSFRMWGVGGVAPPLGERLSKKSPRTGFIVSFWFFWEKAELGKGLVRRELSWAKAELGKHRAELGKGRAELVGGWVGWGLSWAQFWKKGWVGRGLSWKRAELGGGNLKRHFLNDLFWFVWFLRKSCACEKFSTSKKCCCRHSLLSWLWFYFQSSFEPFCALSLSFLLICTYARWYLRHGAPWSTCQWTSGTRDQRNSKRRLLYLRFRRLPRLSRRITRTSSLEMFGDWVLTIDF